MKKIAILLCWMCAVVSGVASASVYKGIVFEDVDSRLTVVEMTHGITATMSDGVMSLTGNDIKMEFTLSQLRHWSFIDENGEIKIGNVRYNGEPLAIICDGSDVCVKGATSASSVRLVGMDGRVVLSRTIGDSCRVSVAGIPAGVYVLVCDDKSFKISIGLL